MYDSFLTKHFDAITERPVAATKMLMTEGGIRTHTAVEDTIGVGIDDAIDEAGRMHKEDVKLFPAISSFYTFSHWRRHRVDLFCICVTQIHVQ